MPIKLTEGIDESLLALLSKGIICITDEIDCETSNYVEKSILLARAGGSPPLKAIINSSGGCLHNGFIIHDIFAAYEGGVTGIVLGKAISAANLILQGCRQRIATFGSILLVHELSTTGKLNILRDKKKFQEFLDELVTWQNKAYKIYQNRTGKNRQELRRIFEKEKLLTPEQALEYGFIDAVIDPKQLALGSTNEATQEIEIDSEQLMQLLNGDKKKK